MHVVAAAAGARDRPKPTGNALQLLPAGAGSRWRQEVPSPPRLFGRRCCAAAAVAWLSCCALRGARVARSGSELVVMGGRGAGGVVGTMEALQLGAAILLEADAADPLPEDAPELGELVEAGELPLDDGDEDEDEDEDKDESMPSSGLSAGQAEPEPELGVEQTEPEPEPEPEPLGVGGGSSSSGLTAADEDAGRWQSPSSPGHDSTSSTEAGAPPPPSCPLPHPGASARPRTLTPGRTNRMRPGPSITARPCTLRPPCAVKRRRRRRRRRRVRGSG
jgi:hypothetical protein